MKKILLSILSICLCVAVIAQDAKPTKEQTIFMGNLTSYFQNATVVNNDITYPFLREVQKVELNGDCLLEITYLNNTNHVNEQILKYQIPLDKISKVYAGKPGGKQYTFKTINFECINKENKISAIVISQKNENNQNYLPKEFSSSSISFSVDTDYIEEIIEALNGLAKLCTTINN